MKETQDALGRWLPWRTGTAVLVVSAVGLVLAAGCSGSASTAVDSEVTDSVSTFEPEKFFAGVGTGLYKALINPEFVLADEAVSLDGPDIVLGLSAGGEHRAYPIRQAAFHHVVNDEIGGVPYLVTY